MERRLPILVALLVLALPPARGAGQVTAAGAAPPPDDRRPEGGGQVVLEVPASASVLSPVEYPQELAPGDRLVIESTGTVRGTDAATCGGIPPGALVGSFAGGPEFLVGRGRLLWAAPSVGRLAFAVEQSAGRRLSGSYSVRVMPLGARGDPRQRRFPPPSIAFLSRREGGPFLALRYADQSGFGLDPKTLQVVLDTEAGERVVLSPYFQTGSSGATLAALPGDVRLPPGVHRVRATIKDALGNVSPAAEIFVDQP